MGCLVQVKPPLPGGWDGKEIQYLPQDGFGSDEADTVVNDVTLPSKRSLVVVITCLQK
jgi:hypothetical protein